MELENGSAHHLTRDTRSSGFLPSSRATIATPPASPQSQSGRRISGPRRIRSAEQAALTHRSHHSSDQENKGVIHRHTTSVDTIRTRFSKPKKSTDVADYETTLLSITSAGAIKHKLKSFLPSSIIVLDLGALDQGPRKPRRVEKSFKKVDSIPTSKPSTTILNVDHTDVVTRTATHTTTPLSIDASDDLSRWDMDYTPSFHSAPGSAVTSTRSSTHTPPPPNSTPFSSPIDDDGLLENEIPFPLNRHSKVIMENMGVKKVKTLARSRSASGISILNRPTVLPKPESALIASVPCRPDTVDSKLLGLPNPLPLRTLCQNREAQHPLGSPSTTVPMPPAKSPQNVKVPPVPNPSASRQDAWGCTHLGAVDCELSIVFPQTSHFEVWDMGDSAHVACPVMLCIMAKDPQKWSGKPLALPDVSLIDIRCEDSPFPSSMSRYDHRDEYATFYTGSKTGTANDDLIASDRPHSGSGISQNSITLDGKWVRTYTKPGVESNGRTRVHRRDGLRALMGTDEYGGTATVRGWYLQFWIPIRTQLFEKRETRAFNINARVWMMGDEQRVLSLDENEDGQAFPLLADAEMTVSHLRKEREMERWRW